ncbi:MAG: hypothetical protein JRC92_04105 [Deltaproteobacteria bacterium]|nr:hypothetical protein [Deltaproteobacteria bacterium]
MSRSGWLLVVLLLLFLARAWLYAGVLPFNGMPDELEHMAQVRVAQYWPQIERGETEAGVVAAEVRARWAEVSGEGPKLQAPAWRSPERRSLYYRALGAWLRLLKVHDPLMAWDLCRLISILMGLGVLVFTWLTARTLFPREPAVPVLAAGLVALLPQFAAVAATVNQDNLASLYTAAFFWLAARTTVLGLDKKRAVAGVVMILIMPGLKKTTYFILAAMILAGVIHALRRVSGRAYAWAVYLLTTAGLALAAYLLLFVPAVANRIVPLIGLPLYRTWEAGFDPALFHQPGIREALAQNIRLADPVFWLHLKSLVLLFFKSFFAYFGYLQAPIGWGWYAGAGIICLMGLAGWLRRGRFPLAPAQRQALAFLGLSAAMALVFIFFRQVVFFPGSLAQGRHLFPALIPLSLLWAVGFRAFWPARLLPWAAAGALGFFWVMDASALWQGAVPWFYRLHF